MTEIDPEFEARNRQLIQGMAADESFRDLSRQWITRAVTHEYAYHFKWLGLPIIQHPVDMIAVQEIVTRVRPQLIIETGVARGGSVVFYASLLELLGNGGRVVGVEIALRPHNRRAINEHPLSSRIDLLDGSSISPQVVAQVRAKAQGHAPVLVILDSNHTHAHVAEEIELYAPLVTTDSYLIVLDTMIADIPKSVYPDKAYGPDNNPKTAVQQFLQRSPHFIIDQEYDQKLVLSAAPGGYLRRIRSE